MSGSKSETDHLPTASLDNLRVRARLLAAVRRFFDERGYLEVETPLLSADATVDPNLDPFVAKWAPAGAGRSGGRDMYLQTSPEFAMKRLLAAGATAIYQVTRAFRNGELGRLHNPEFTIAEWYRVGDTYCDQMGVTEELVRCVLGETVVHEPPGLPGILRDDSQSGARACHWWSCRPRSGQQTTRPAHLNTAIAECAGRAARAPEDAFFGIDGLPFARTSYQCAFERHANFDPLRAPTSKLPQVAAQHGLTPPPGLEAGDRDGWLNFLLVELVEPKLGFDSPELLFDYPASQAALARVRQDKPPVAERFELYIRGIEICNGYQELTDADELRGRIREQNLEARLNSRLLDAMDAGLPPCSGVALGFDRLVMLATGASALSEVTAFPFDRA